MKNLVVGLVLLALSSPAFAYDEDDMCILFNICPQGPVLKGVTYLPEDECAGFFERDPFTASPFIRGVCARYHTVRQQFSSKDRVFFAKRTSDIAKLDGEHVAEIKFDDRPELTFYIGYGLADAIETAELSRLYKATPGCRTPEPYQGKPLERLSLDMLANFEVFKTDTRHIKIDFDLASGVVFFSSIEVIPYPDQGIAYVRVALTEMGVSVLRQALDLHVPLYGVLTWRVNHRFGEVSLSSVGEISCIEWADDNRLRPCSSY